MAVFAVSVVRGPGWDDSLERREQRGWDAHAEFMDALVDDGFVILGGPIGDQRDVLLAVEAASEHEVSARFVADPWADPEIILISDIRPWTLLLDSRA